MAHLLANIQLDKTTKPQKATNSVADDSSEALSTSSSNESDRSYDSYSSDFEDDQLSPAYSQLLKAITNGNLAVVKQMLDYGLNVNYIYDKEQNYSFLHLACLMGHSKVIKYLLDCGANANFVTTDGHQPIDFIESDDINTISYMLMKMKSTSSK